MDGLAQDFRELEIRARKLVEQEAKLANPHRITRLAELLSACEEARSEAINLEKARDSIAAELEGRLTPDAPAAHHELGPLRGPTAATPGHVSRKAKGKLMRNTFLNKLESKRILLRQVKGAVYERATGGRVGIACATELPKSPDKWFLGLPDDHYQAIVLLCQSQSGEVADFVLPADMLYSLWNCLTRSAGQVKFHVERNGDIYSLVVPGGGRKSIHAYLSQYAALR